MSQRPQVSRRLNPVLVRAVNDTLSAHGRMVPDRPLINTEPLVSDREDDFVIQLARQAQAVIVTGDKALRETAPPGVAVLDIGVAASEIERGGSLQLALADRRGNPILTL